MFFMSLPTTEFVNTLKMIGDNKRGGRGHLHPGRVLPQLKEREAHPPISQTCYVTLQHGTGEVLVAVQSSLEWMIGVPKASAIKLYGRLF